MSLTSAEVASLLDALNKAVAASDTERQHEIICEMQAAGWAKRMSVACLKESRAGIVLNSLRSSSSDRRIATAAASLVDAWREMAKKKSVSTDSGAASASAAASTVKGPSTKASSSAAASWTPAESELPKPLTLLGASSGPVEHAYDVLYKALSPRTAPVPADVHAALGYAYDSTQVMNAKRARILRQASGSAAQHAPIVYWMSRDQRAADNWALLHARSIAASTRAPLVVVFALAPSFAGANARSYGFMLRGLMRVEEDLSALGIPFRLLLGSASEQVSAYANGVGAAALVTDFSPTRVALAWKRGVAESLHAACRLIEVDAHNIVPAWVASDHVEVGARTFRKKIHVGVHTFCTPFPPVKPSDVPLPSSCEAAFRTFSSVESASSAASAAQAGRGGSSSGVQLAPRRADSPEMTDWRQVLSFLNMDYSVPEVTWLVPGERAARDSLHKFLTARLKRYDDLRNDPTHPEATSNLSPYMHYGHLSGQRVILELSAATGMGLRALFPEGERKGGAVSFAEEITVRRELADNFCLYQPEYDSLAGASEWARASLLLHAADKRDAVYSRADFEACRTHEQLWNAMQSELIHRGKMAGWARMYWAKKILEWSATPAEALATAIYLNDKYSLDGRDPNGWVGCMWAIVGTHDMGWTERPVFGKIRFMNLTSTLKKFDVPRYIAQNPVRKIVCAPPLLGKLV
jgi:deoxyribodipyrimidine photo-lyase